MVERGSGKENTVCSATGPTRFQTVDVESNERTTDRSMETCSVEDSGITRWVGPWREIECVCVHMYFSWMGARRERERVCENVYVYFSTYSFFFSSREINGSQSCALMKIDLTP